MSQLQKHNLALIEEFDICKHDTLMNMMMFVVGCCASYKFNHSE